MSYKKALFIQTILLPVLFGALTVISFFLVRFVSHSDAQAQILSSHEARIAKLESVTEMLSRLADKYDLRFEKMDTKIESRHGSGSGH